MGAWGFGVFDNDSASDAIHSVINASEKHVAEGEHWFTSMEKTIQQCLDMDYLDYEDTAELTTIAVLLFVLLDKEETAKNISYEVFEPRVSKWAETVQAADPKYTETILAAREKLHAGLVKSVGKQSEMNELWEEAGEESYNQWRKHMDYLTKRTAELQA